MSQSLIPSLEALSSSGFRRLVLLEVHCTVINVEYLCLVLNIIQSIRVDVRSTENMEL